MALPGMLAAAALRVFARGSFSRDFSALSSRQQSAEGLDKAVDVVLGIVDMRADPHPAEPRRDINALGREFPDQALGHAAAEAEAENVRRAQRFIRERNAVAAQAAGEPFGQHGKPLADRRAAPGRDLLDTHRRHFQRDEMIALPHVEAARIADIVEILEIPVGLGIYTAPAGAGLLE